MTVIPVEQETPVLEPLSRSGRALMHRACGDREVQRLFATGTRVDTGTWFRGARVWVGVLPDGLALIADGPRPLVQHIAAPDLHGSLYNHVTGELILAPAAGAAVRALRIDPLSAQWICARVLRGDELPACR